MITRTTATLLASLLLLALVPGCHYRTRKHTVIAEDAELFTLSEELYHRYDDTIYQWNTVLTDARVEFRVRHFETGTARVRVYDADGVEIFDRSYHDFEFLYYVGDLEFLQVGFTAAEAAAGRWQIRIETWDFSGSLYLTLD